MRCSACVYFVYGHWCCDAPMLNRRDIIRHISIGSLLSPIATGYRVGKDPAIAQVNGELWDLRRPVSDGVSAFLVKICQAHK